MCNKRQYREHRDFDSFQSFLLVVNLSVQICYMIEYATL